MDGESLQNAALGNPQTRIVFKGVLAADQIRTVRENGCYIVNTSASDDPGSHWIVLILTAVSIGYLCPLGRPVHRGIRPYLLSSDLLKGRLLFRNTRAYQPVVSSSCGIFCLLFVLAHADRKRFSVKMLKLSGNSLFRDNHAWTLAKKHFSINLKALTV